ncbi:helix-turn-helix transcriptional regulator [Streptomyces sp. NPDC057020]|uniref:helix-turn-helix transcriptional regulator n=1 Tax=unclassified Streptomyces TaxID=2593676 RepID=UPI00363EDD35
MRRNGEHVEWTFLTNHARVLLAVSRDPGVLVREIAQSCDVTERTVLGIIADLEEAGYLTRDRGPDGRRNHYTIVPGGLFRHPAEARHEIAGLLTLLAEPHPAAPQNGRPAPLGQPDADRND